jgi:hypothetical protein
MSQSASTTPAMTHQDKPCWSPPNDGKKEKINTYDIKTPFWFGFEDNEHIAKILKIYSDNLRVNADRPKNSRQPIQFVGRVERYPVSSDDKTFWTVDKVYIYQHVARYWGQIMPLVRTVTLKTQWHLLDGVPIKQTILDQEPQLYNNTQKPSQLYSFPVFNNCDLGKEAIFEYNHGPQNKNDWQVGYADLFNQCLQNTMPLKNHDTVTEQGSFEPHVKDEDDDEGYEYVEEDEEEEEKPVVDLTYILNSPPSIVVNNSFDQDFEFDNIDEGQDYDFSSDEESYEDEVDSPIRWIKKDASPKSPYSEVSHYNHFQTVIHKHHDRHSGGSPIVLCQ